jgi:DNA-binding beta-propeller fold protein YncE
MRRLALAGLCALTLTLALSAAPARAERSLISNHAVQSEGAPGGIEDACGVALLGGNIYVSDYYHQRVDVFNAAGSYLSQIVVGTSPEGPCGLATGPGSALYANLWHQRVLRLAPTSLSFDEAESTGVAVDQTSGDVYVDDRTYVAVYEASGAPVEVGGEPLLVGQGSLGDAYGVAVYEGRVYAADAASGTVKVYEPAGDPDIPVATIAGPPGGFHSLVDASLAIDPAGAHLLVVDNLQPGYLHPEAAIEEFDSAGAYLGHTSNRIVDGEPSGLAVSGGKLYASSGNSAGAGVFEFGSYFAAASLVSAGGGGGGSSAAAAAPQLAAAPAAPTAAASVPRDRRGGAHAHASELLQRGHIRVALDADFAPKRLPRHGAAPIRLSVGAKISSTKKGEETPQLRRLTIEVNREGRFDPTGLPVCRLREIEPATTANALRACRGALVGEGSFGADVGLSHQSPFPQGGKLYAFNARLHGRPAILSHVYGTDPVPTSYTLPFEIGKAKGTFGLLLRAALPPGDAGRITELSLDLGRNFSYRGKRRSYLSAGCPAPKGFPGAVFPLARVKLAFAGGKTLSTTLNRNCKAR